MADRRGKSKVENANKMDPNAWMTTFSDLLTLMLTFFVLLLSMSSMDDRALRETFGFFKDKMGLLRRAASAEKSNNATLPISTFIADDVFSKMKGFQNEHLRSSARLVTMIEHLIDENDLEHLLQARPVRGGIAITIASDVLFAPGSNRLMPESLPVLDSMADLLKQNPNLHLRVDGVQQQQGGQQDPWRVATERSLAVVSHLLSKSRVDGRQLAVAGYGPGWSRSGLPGKSNKVELVLTWYAEPLRPR